MASERDKEFFERILAWLKVHPIPVGLGALWAGLVVISNIYGGLKKPFAPLFQQQTWLPTVLLILAFGFAIVITHLESKRAATKGAVESLSKSLTSQALFTSSNITLADAGHIVCRELIHTVSREEMYNLGTSIIRGAKNRLYIVQRTPSLFLGSRSYDERGLQPILYEEEFLKALCDWINLAEQKEDHRELRYLFSLSETRKEIRRRSGGNQGYIEQLSQRIRTYKRVEAETGRLMFLPLTTEFSGPVAIGDGRFALWLLGTDDAVCISQENPEIADVLCRVLGAHARSRLTENALLKQLGINC